MYNLLTFNQLRMTSNYQQYISTSVCIVANTQVQILKQLVM